ncbi:MAG TPA: DedA family protein [Bacilli bacterium]|nr:DedA family protein [Bacilli bacterium]
MIDQSVIVDVIVHYGYFGLFVLLMLGIAGIPLPDEALMAVAGYQVHVGHLNFWGVLAAAALGSSCGITLSYYLGRFLGREVVKRFGKFFHLTEERLLKVEQYMERYGGLAIFFGYFVPGLRHVTALSAGFGQMKFRLFALPAYLGALFWTGVFLVLGRYLGKEIHKLEHLLYPFRFWILALVVVSFGTPLVVRIVKRRMEKR